MTNIELAAYILQLERQLTGAKHLHTYMLHKLGGSLVIEKDELNRVCKDFPGTKVRQKADTLHVQLVSDASLGGYINESEAC